MSENVDQLQTPGRPAPAEPEEDRPLTQRELVMASLLRCPPTEGQAERQ